MTLEFTFAPSAEQHCRWKLFVLAWVLQAQLLASIIAMTRIFPAHERHSQIYNYVRVVTPYRSTVTKVQPLVPAIPVSTLYRSLTSPVAAVPRASNQVNLERTARIIRRSEPALQAPHLQLSSTTRDFPRLPDAPPATI